jgi:pimeloyl-ACP methyl ester carboxylesterase
VAFDAPAHGETPGRQTNIFACAAALEAVVRECGPVHGVLTHSFGGMVLAYALQHGVTTRRAVCISAPANLEFLVESFSRALALPRPVVAVLRRWQGQRFGGDLSERVSTDSNVRTLAVPALIIHDVNDRDVPWQQGSRIAAAWPGARFLKTRGLGHRRILRDPATINAVVEFFRAQ